MAKVKQFIDIGANLSDSMYQGIYNGNQKHKADLLQVLKRSWDSGLSKMIITGGSLSESKAALDLAQTDGCHPTRCLEFDENPNEYYEHLKELALNGGKKVVAIGECGLDYDRLQFCPKDVQKTYFKKQLCLSKELNLPLFLHCRNAADDLKEILTEFSDLKGVVHSFDGTKEEARTFIEMGFLIGLNGCSLKTAENLETIKTIPSNKLLIETDCPWCEIRPTHAGYKFIKSEHNLPAVKKEKWTENSAVKGRNEPANIRHVLDIIAAVRTEDPSTLCETIYENTQQLFF